MGTTVLLADDSITIQKVVGIIFANEDYDLVVVDNGNSALEKAREIMPSVMLVDALMPDMSGYDVCAEIRRDPALKNIPILLLVGAFEPFDEEKARTSGIDDHITKPFESQNLLERVHALLDMGAARSAASTAQPEEPAPSFAGMSPAEEPSPAPSVSANIIEPFRGFIHLGSEETEDVKPVEVAPSLETVTPADADAGSEGIIVLSSVDIVEANPDDDPWGAFEEDGQICFGEALEDDLEGVGEMVEEIEPSVQADQQPEVAEIRFDEPAAALEDTSWADVGAPSVDEPPAFQEETQHGALSMESPAGGPAGGSFAAERISLGDTSSAVTVADVHGTGETDSYSFGLTADSVASTAEPEFGFAPDEAYVPVPEPFEAIEPTPAVAAPVGEPAPGALSEKQLAAVISQISREIIEKIAWDVVPDLAETIIREEIRKIKEGIGR